MELVHSCRQKNTNKQGGTRSSKTFSILQILTIWLVTGKCGEHRNIPKGVASIVRKFKNSHPAASLRDFENLIDEYGVRDLLEYNKTKLTFKYKERILEFIGADDEQKVRGPARKILYCNEANELDYHKEFFQLNIRTEEVVFLDFNPDDPHIWINTELEQKRLVEEKDVVVYVSNYKDNTLIPALIRKEIEILERSGDASFWQTYGLGEYGNLQGLIFQDWNIVNEIPKTAELVAHGLDFGFTNDVTAVLSVYKNSGELWIDEYIYETGLVNIPIGTNPPPNIYDKLTGFGIKNNIVADSAEQKSIAELRLKGLGIEGAKKGPDSIKQGIDILKRYKINVTSRSANLLKENRTYKWKVDRNGKTLNEPIDFNNHLMDALRYVALNKLPSNNKGKYSVL